MRIQKLIVLPGHPRSSAPPILAGSLIKEEPHTTTYPLVRTFRAKTALSGRRHHLWPIRCEVGGASPNPILGFL